MKKLLLGTVALAALGASANAADMRVRPVVAAPIALTTWTGCHVGIAAGNEWGRNDGGFTATSATRVLVGAVPTPIVAGTPLAQGFNMNGFIGSAYAGCDFQAGAWVFGVEGDWSTLNKEGQAFNVPFAVVGVAGVLPPNFAVFKSAERWMATARGRLGYAVDKWLFYVTGGAAWVKIDSAEWNITVPGPTANLQSDTRTGWTVGVGLDYALSYGWSLRSEYLYVQIPSYTTFTPGSQPNNPGFSFPTNLSTGRLTNNIWRAGLTYKFGYYP